MPLETPDTAERMKQIVSVTMITTSSVVLTDVHEPAGDEAAADLQRAQAERGGRTEQRREDRQDVDGLAEPALGALAAEQRDERRAEQLRAAAAEGAVGDGQADHRVDRPRVQGPVEQRGGHRDVERLGRARRGGARRGRGEVRQRLGDAVEHQPDAHAGAEHHRDPGGGPELRRLVVAAERDAAVAAHRPATRAKTTKPLAASTNAQPPPVMMPPSTDFATALSDVGAEHAPGDEREDDRGRDPEHGAVDDGMARRRRAARRRRRRRSGRPTGAAGIACVVRAGPGGGGRVVGVVQRHGRRPRRAGALPPPVWFRRAEYPAPPVTDWSAPRRGQTESDRYATSDVDASYATVQVGVPFQLD